MINAIILASGYGKRMGKNKLLLPLKNKPVLEYVMEVVLEYSFNDIVLVAREEEVIKLSKDKGIRTIANKEAYKGQSESVKLGIKDSMPADGYMFFTGDQPFIKKEHVVKIISNFYKDKRHIIVPKNGDSRGTPVIFPVEFKDELLSLEGDEGGRAVIRNNPERVRFVEIEDKELFFDIDTEEDYEYALKRREG